MTTAFVLVFVVPVTMAIATIARPCPADDGVRAPHRAGGPAAAARVGRAHPAGRRAHRRGVARSRGGEAPTACSRRSRRTSTSCSTGSPAGRQRRASARRAVPADGHPGRGDVCDRRNRRARVRGASAGASRGSAANDVVTLAARGDPRRRARRGRHGARADRARRRRPGDRRRALRRAARGADVHALHRAGRRRAGAGPGGGLAVLEGATGLGIFLLVWTRHRRDDGQLPAADPDPQGRRPAAAADLRRRDRRPAGLRAGGHSSSARWCWRSPTSCCTAWIDEVPDPRLAVPTAALQAELPREHPTEPHQ